MIIRFSWFIAIISLACMVLTTPPSPEKLKRVKGEVIVNDLKNGGVGSILKLKTEQNTATSLNVTGLRKDSNGIVRKLAAGDTVEALYSDRFTLRNGSHDVWFLQFNDQILLSYQERKKLNFFIRVYLV